MAWIRKEQVIVVALMLTMVTAVGPTCQTNDLPCLTNGDMTGKIYLLREEHSNPSGWLRVRQVDIFNIYPEDGRMKGEGFRRIKVDNRIHCFNKTFYCTINHTYCASGPVKDYLIASDNSYHISYTVKRGESRLRIYAKDLKHAKLTRVEDLPQQLLNTVKERCGDDAGTDDYYKYKYSIIEEADFMSKCEKWGEW